MSADQRETGAGRPAPDRVDDSAAHPGADTMTSHGRVRTRALVLVGLLVSLVLAGFVSFYASSHPDGLEFVAGEKGFLGSATDHPAGGSPFADYATRGIEDARLSGGIAAVVGALVVGVLAFAVFRLLAGRRSRR